MIELTIKRIKGNKSVTFGRLTIPRYNFSCHTLELADGEGRVFKHNCSIDTGVYQLKPGYGQRCALFPTLRYKPIGFAKKPEIVLENGDYQHMKTGDIALGVGIESNWAIRQTNAFADIFRDLATRMAHTGEIMVLSIHKSKNYSFEDISYEETLQAIQEMNYFDDEEQAELDDNEE